MCASLKRLVAVATLAFALVTPRVAGAAETVAAVGAANDTSVLAVAPLSLTGFGKDISAELATHLERELSAMGVKLLLLTEKRGTKRNCLDSPACVRELAKGIPAAGLLSLKLVRVGPTVRITARVLRTDTGVEVRRGGLAAAADTFPGGWDVKKDLGDMLAVLPSLQAERRRTEAPAAVTSPPAPAAEPQPAIPAVAPPTRTASPAEALPTAPAAATALSPASSGSEGATPEPMTAVTGTPPPPAKRAMLPWIVAGSGAAVAIVGGGVALVESRTLHDRKSSGDDKTQARQLGRIGLGAIGVGAAVALVGVVLGLIATGD